MSSIVGTYHALWLLLPVARNTVLELLPVDNVPGVHLQPYKSIPIPGLPEGTHPVLIEVGQEHDCGPSGFRGLFRSQFHECKLEIPYVQHPQYPGVSLCYKALVLMDKRMNVMGSERLYGLRALRAAFSCSFSGYEAYVAANAPQDAVGISSESDDGAGGAQAEEAAQEEKERQAQGEEEKAGLSESVGDASEDHAVEKEEDGEEAGEGESVRVECGAEFLDVQLGSSDGFLAYGSVDEQMEIYLAIMKQPWFGGLKAKFVTQEKLAEEIAALAATGDEKDTATNGTGGLDDGGAVFAVDDVKVSEGEEKQPAAEEEEAEEEVASLGKETLEPISNPAVPKRKRKKSALGTEVSSPRLPSSLSSSFILRVDMRSSTNAVDKEEEEEGEVVEEDGWATEEDEEDIVVEEEDGGEDIDVGEEWGDGVGSPAKAKSSPTSASERKEDEGQDDIEGAKERMGGVEEPEEVDGEGAEDAEEAEATQGGKQNESGGDDAEKTDVQPPALDEEDEDIADSKVLLCKRMEGNEGRVLDLHCMVHEYDVAKMAVKPVAGCLEVSPGFWSGSSQLLSHTRAGAGLQVTEMEMDEREEFVDDASEAGQGKKKAGLFSKMFRWSKAEESTAKLQIRFPPLSAAAPFGGVQVVAPFSISKAAVRSSE